MATMTMETIDNRLFEIMAEKLGLEATNIKMTDSFSDDLGIDSLDTYELLVAVEKRFGIKINDDEAEKLRTVGALANYVHSHLS
jgi:acyl carrier protein